MDYPSAPQPRKRRGLRFWQNLIIAGMQYGYGLYIAGVVFLLTKPAQTDICCVTPSDIGFPYDDVLLTTKDGLGLAGWYIPSQNNPAIILAHGDGGDRLGMLPQAEMLADVGFGTHFAIQLNL